MTTRSSILVAMLLSGCALYPPSARRNEISIRSASRKAVTADAPASVVHWPQDPSRDGSGRRALVGIGMTEDPDTLLLGGELDFPVSDRFLIGPMVQLGLDDHTTLFAPSLHGKYLLPLDHAPGSTRWAPFVQGGVGIAYLSKDKPGADDDLGLLLQAGGGVEVRFEDQVGVATTLLIDFLPGGVFDENVYLSWQVVQFSFRF